MFLCFFLHVRKMRDAESTSCVLLMLDALRYVETYPPLCKKLVHVKRSKLLLWKKHENIQTCDRINVITYSQNHCGKLQATTSHY